MQSVIAPISVKDTNKNFKHFSLAATADELEILATARYSINKSNIGGRNMPRLDLQRNKPHRL